MEQQTNPLNILVADDETAMTATVSYVLKRAGHNVDVVHDGSEALELIKKSPDEYQLLITDHSMQNVSGLELVEKLHKTPFRGRIFVMSAYLTEDLKSSYKNQGVSQFIDKPFEIGELREAVGVT